MKILLGILIIWFVFQVITIGAARAMNCHKPPLDGALFPLTMWIPGKTCMSTGDTEGE